MFSKLLLLLLLVPILGMADDIEHLKDFKIPIKCYPIIENTDGTIDKGNPVILYWINLVDIYPKLVFMTMQGDKFVVPSDSYLCTQ